MTDIRDKSAALLSSTLEGLAPSNAQANERAVALEAAVFDKHAGQTGNEYRNEVRQLSLDLGKNNTEMGQKVAEGILAPRTLVQMSGDQLKSDERAAADTEMTEQALRESLGEGKIPASSQESAPEVLSGEEGDFKRRAQLHIEGLQGIEFETGT